MLDTSKIYTSRNYGKFKITNYTNSRNVDVEFVSTGFKVRTRSDAVELGNVKDLLFPSVKGIGFVGEGHHKAVIKRKTTKAYETWKSMLNRCYGVGYQKRNKSYRGVTVCREWHNFQNFAGWFELNYIKGYQLDKDIKIKGNNVYSAESCLFVSARDNSVEASAKEYKLTNPKGVVVKVFNMAQFCRDESLNSGAMIQVAKGKTSQHKGWTKA